MTTEAEARELLPCPFCGVAVNMFDMDTVRHPNASCVLACDHFDLDKWNTRASTPQPIGEEGWQGMREALEEARSMLETCAGQLRDLSYRDMANDALMTLHKIDAALTLPPPPSVVTGDSER